MNIQKTKIQDPIYKELIQERSLLLQTVAQEIHKTIVGQHQAIEFMLISLLCKSHFLLEGVPGVAKTTMIKTLAQTLGLSFKRIQFTPDLLPSDLIGTLLFNTKTQEFETKKGPIFAHIILADEINRAPSKVQSALLEAMQEQQVTIGSQTFKLDEPFLVCATQNPLEQEGTYRLPEAQIDRFMFKIIVNYPTINEEKLIITKYDQQTQINEILYRDDINKLFETLDYIYVDERILDYILRIIERTRNKNKYFIYGASPRATIALYKASKAYAFLHGRHFVTPDDVKSIAIGILGHRLPLNYEFEEQSTHEIINEFISSVPAP